MLSYNQDCNFQRINCSDNSSWIKKIKHLNGHCESWREVVKLFDYQTFCLVYCSMWCVGILIALFSSSKMKKVT